MKKSIKDLKATMPQVGKIEWIGLRPKKKADLRSVDSAQITVAAGLEGDHNVNPGGKRMVTLIQQEHLDMVSRVMGRDVTPDMTRRNIVVSGINLLALQDADIKLGDDVILRGTGFCVPCSRMEENLGDGGYNAMRGHGGITTTVVSGGEIKVGDEIKLHI